MSNTPPLTKNDRTSNNRLKNKKQKNVKKSKNTSAKKRKKKPKSNKTAAATSATSLKKTAKTNFWKRWKPALITPTSQARTTSPNSLIDLLMRPTPVASKWTPLLNILALASTTKPNKRLKINSGNRMSKDTDWTLSLLPKRQRRSNNAEKKRRELWRTCLICKWNFSKKVKMLRLRRRKH